MGSRRALDERECGERDRTQIRSCRDFGVRRNGRRERVAPALVRVGPINLLVGGDRAVSESEGDGRDVSDRVTLPTPIGRARLAECAQAQQRREQRLQDGQEGGRRDQNEAPLCCG